MALCRRSPVRPVTENFDPHRIDTVGQRRARLQGDIRRWKSHARTTLGAALNAPSHAPRRAQRLGCTAHIALRQLEPDCSGGKDFAVFCHRTDNADAEAQLLARQPHGLWRARTALAEEKIIADDDVARCQPLDQHLLDELVGRQRCKRLVERQHHHDIDAQILQALQLQGERRKMEMRLVGLEEFTRVRLEHDHPAGRIQCCRTLEHFRDERLVTAMDAIEVADCQHRAPGLLRHFGRSCNNQHAPPLACRSTHPEEVPFPHDRCAKAACAAASAMTDHMAPCALKRRATEPSAWPRRQPPACRPPHKRIRTWRASSREPVR